MNFYRAFLFTFLLLWMANCNGFAQLTETRNVGSFSKISAGGALELIIRQGNREQIEIEASNINSEDIKVEVKGQTLHLGLKSGNYNNVKLKMIVTYQQLRQINTQGSVQLKNQSTLKANYFTLNTSGSSKIALSLDVEQLVMQCSGASTLKLNGKADKQKITLSGAGNIAAFDLITQDTEITVSGAGNVNTHASQRLVATVSGAGNISYKGNPTQTQFRQSGAGRISPKN